MPSSYTTSLRLTLPATGELSGQWGTTVNTGITELLDAAVAGTASISTWGGAGVAYTLSNNSGTADEARKMFIVATGSPGEAKNVICPAVSKFYVFRNDTTGGFALTLKTSGGTGIAVPAGQYKFLYCDGTNVVEMFNSAGALTLSGALSVGGTATFAANPTLSAGTANQVQYLNASKVLTGSANLTFDGTTLTAANFADSSLTNTRVVYAGASGNLTDSANLTFNGTDLTVSGAVNAGSVNATTLDLTNIEVTNVKAKDGTSAATIADSTGVVSFTANPILSGGTANGVLYLNASKVATSGTALVFDGTNLGVGTSSPARRLHVDTTAAAAARFTRNGGTAANNTIEWFNGTNSWFAGVSTADAFGVAYNTGGNLAVGAAILTIDSSYNLTVNAGSNNASAVRVTNNIGITAGIFLANPTVDHALGFQTNSIERARITSGGDFLIGTTSTVTGSKLVVDTGDATIYGVRVGRGAGAVATNTAVGNNALVLNTSGSNSVGVGASALYNQTTAGYNTAVGVNAIYGAGAGMTGSSNVGIGASALEANSSGANNVAIGRQALVSNTTASNNTAVGYQALYTNTTSSNNTAIGNLSARTYTGTGSTFAGAEAGYSATTGNYLTVTGFQAVNNAAVTGSNIEAYGYRALFSNTSGANNVAIGSQSLYSNTTANYNTAVGYQALYTNTTPTGNVALGYQAGYASNPTGAVGLVGANVFIGFGAGVAATTAANLTIVGAAAGYNLLGGGSNTLIGRIAGYNLTSGTFNTFVGPGDSNGGSGYLVSTGAKNTIIGAYSGNQGGLDIRTASNYIVLSDGDGNPRLVGDGSGNFGIGTTSPVGRLRLAGSSANAFPYKGGVLWLTDTNAAADKQNWSIASDATVFKLSTGNDTFSSGQNAYVINRGTAAEVAEHIWYTGATSERARITSGGDLLVGATSSASGKVQTTVAAVGDVGVNIIGPSSDNNWTGTLKFQSNNGTTVTSTIIASTSGLSMTYGGTTRATINSSGNLQLVNNLSVGNATPTTSGTGITFPATQSASSDANTLDDYEEGTWTPNQGGGLTVTGAFSSAGTYTKVGNLVFVRGYVQGATNVSVIAGGIISTNLPFTSAADTCAGSATNYNVNQTSGTYASTGTSLYANSALTASLQIIFGITYRV